MPVIYIIDQLGVSHELKSEVGASVMEIAVQNGITGISAECGGACSCATCHVYVEDVGNRFPAASDHECMLLDYTEAERRVESRLGCQLIISTEHDGLVVRVPEAV